MLLLQGPQVRSTNNNEDLQTPGARFKMRPPLTYPCFLIGPFPLSSVAQSAAQITTSSVSLFPFQYLESPGALRASHASGDSPAFILKTASRL